MTQQANSIGSKTRASRLFWGILSVISLTATAYCLVIDFPFAKQMFQQPTAEHWARFTLAASGIYFVFIFPCLVRSFTDQAD